MNIPFFGSPASIGGCFKKNFAKGENKGNCSRRYRMTRRLLMPFKVSEPQTLSL